MPPHAREATGTKVKKKRCDPHSPFWDKKDALGWS
jgi:hypothetical protein